MPRSFPVRGIIEGFYGPPWEPRARLDVIEFVGERSMNAYVYAPKGDPKHRDRWREPYDGPELGHFADIAETTRRLAMQFGFALSPGLDIDYRAATDRSAVLGKLTPLLDAGVGWIVLALDDIPLRPHLERDQVDLTRWLLDALRQRDPSLRLTVVPTEYVGTFSTPYLRELGTRLPEDVDVMWTGPTVCSPVIRAEHARTWSAALGNRPPLIWDNYPVNDGSMERSVHLGPYRGREPELVDTTVGILCNPMLQARASMVALATAADYLRDPHAYDAEESWDRAVSDVGGTSAGALRGLASACADGPVLAPERLEVHRLTEALAEAGAGTEWEQALASVRSHLETVRDGARELAAAEDDPLAAELAPWLDQARAESRAGLAALDLLERVGAPGLEPDPTAASTNMLHAFATIFGWSGARHRDRVVFGPRFAIYPAVVQLAGGQPGLDVDLALIEDGNATDRLCRFALTRYQEWQRRVGDAGHG